MFSYKHVMRTTIAAFVGLVLSVSSFADSVESSGQPKHVAGENYRVEAAVLSAAPTDQEIIEKTGLIPSEGETNEIDNRALAESFRSFRERARKDDARALEEFLADRGGSRWDCALHAQVGSFYFERGYFSKAIKAWEVAWALGRNETDPKLRIMVDSAVGSLAKMHARVGNFERLESLFKEIGDRPVRGAATELLVGAREGLWLMRNRPEHAFRCGPIALGTISSLKKPGGTLDTRVAAFESTQRGTSLWQLVEFSKSLGLKHRPARRTSGSSFIIPAVIHWKVGHFAALTELRDGRYRIQDPTFGQEFWVTREALEEEASGYFLIPEESDAAGWHPVAREEAERIWGKGTTTASDPDETNKCDKKKGGDNGCGDSKKMATYSVHALLVSLNIEDTPLWYQPAVGPSIDFTLTYNQREGFEFDASLGEFTGFGERWTCNWVTFIEDSGSESAAVKTFQPGGGSRTYSVPGSGFGPRHFRDSTSMSRTSSTSYERMDPDGWKEVFGYVIENSGQTKRRLFRTKVIDPQGNALRFQYETIGPVTRLVAVVDAIGQVTRLEYSGDSKQVTRVIDPFGRFASLSYNDRFAITDIGGFASETHYRPGTDFIESLTTPYGTTRFDYGDILTDPTLLARTRWFEATDPHGAKERVEFNEKPNGIPHSEPAAVVPDTIYTRNTYMWARNTYYWSKKAMAEAPEDLTQAEIIHWLHSIDLSSAIGVPESEKMPLENRVWYNYFGQNYEPGPITNNNGATTPGTQSVPSKVARVLDDGTNQLFQYEYNEFQKVTKIVDPHGRETVFEYAPNNIDLLLVKQKVAGGLYQTLIEYNGYNSQHLPSTAKDAAGQQTTYTYTPYGQIKTVKRVRGGANEITTYEYGADRLANDFARLKRIVGPLTGATCEFTYDSIGRLKTVTESDGYDIAYDYDDLNQLTRISYPDGSYEQVIYYRFEPEWIRDRQGRWTRRFYDALRRIVAKIDSEGRWQQYEWCDCGSLEAIIDGNNNRTSFLYDIQGRLTDRVYPDAKGLHYIYEGTTSRLKTMTDGKGQVATYVHNPDNTLASIEYKNSQGQRVDPSSSQVLGIEYQYDDFYVRVKKMNDITGETNYDYWAVQNGTLGAGRLRWVDGPLPGSIDKIDYAYDEYGRLKEVTHDGVSETIVFDALGRVNRIENDALGNFDYAYVDQTERLSSVQRPNGQYSSYGYHPKLPAAGTGNGEFRLAAIDHRQIVGGPTVSKHNYTYSVAGEITSWTQQIGSSQSSGFVYTFGYDGARQLLSATRSLASNPGTPEKQFSYHYDQAGNRTLEQIDAVVHSGTFNSLNQLKKRNATGTMEMEFEGTIDEFATVSVGGSPASVDGNLRFKAKTWVAPGQQSVEIMATDSNGNTRVKYAPINVMADAVDQDFSYDDNGNLTGDETRTFTWDALNRLKSVTIGANTYSWDYNGNGQRMTEKVNGTAAKRWVWSGTDLIAELNAAGTSVSKRFYNEGELWETSAVSEPPENKHYYTRDHIGSIRDVVDGAKATRVHYDYDPYGRRTAKGTLAHQSVNQAGNHQHFFNGATGSLAVNANDKLIVYVFLDPANPPRELMVQWDAGSWEWDHRAYWGENLISYGVDGTASRKYMGPLPPTGQWVRLEVPANMVGLEGRTIYGMSYDLYDGTAKWDHAGKIDSQGVESVWVDDQLPAGANMFGTWTWVDAGPQSDFGFSGHYFHLPTNICLTLYRAYDADIGRWLSRDPIRESGGSNIFSYVANAPTIFRDPLGLKIDYERIPSKVRDVMETARKCDPNGVGQQLKQLEDSKHTWLFKLTDYNNTWISAQPTNSKNQSNGIGTGGTVYINPGGDTVTQDGTFTPEQVLAHELTHAAAYDKGAFDGTLLNNVPNWNEEVAAVRRQNEFTRTCPAHSNKEIRTKYGGRVVPNP
jgi:RHS repeat-associated protein